MCFKYVLQMLEVQRINLMEGPSSGGVFCAHILSGLWAS
ncbi:hypothetical protein TcasGA2_TC033902 [Tribolium castaneum]|uniref:Uncharacterized protein n=1 Tax=Tribolium castaneum TaxID=7070 RepID=A0A139W9U0_TRICA|nr:hypothetical protein TcasGA2_TC033902 [Tribolium castaneum]